MGFTHLCDSQETLHDPCHVWLQGTKQENKDKTLLDTQHLGVHCIRRPIPLRHMYRSRDGFLRHAVVWKIKTTLHHHPILGKWQYRSLPLGLTSTPDIFQARIGQLFRDTESVIVYMDDLLIVGIELYEKHIQTFDEVLTRLESKQMEVNLNKSSGPRLKLLTLGS